MNYYKLDRTYISDKGDIESGMEETLWVGGCRGRTVTPNQRGTTREHGINVPGQVAVKSCGGAPGETARRQR